MKRSKVTPRHSEELEPPNYKNIKTELQLSDRGPRLRTRSRSGAWRGQMRERATPEDHYNSLAAIAYLLGGWLTKSADH